MLAEKGPTKRGSLQIYGFFTKVFQMRDRIENISTLYLELL